MKAPLPIDSCNRATSPSSPFTGKLSYAPALTQLLDKALSVEDGAPDARRLVSTRINQDNAEIEGIDFAGDCPPSRPASSGRS